MLRSARTRRRCASCQFQNQNEAPTIIQPINPSITTDAWFNFQLDFVRCMWVVLPGAILWGASFPLALASLASRGQDPARLVGSVYAANTVGAIVGSLGGSLLMVTWLGSQHAQQVLIILCGLSALLMLVMRGCSSGPSF